MLSLFRSDEAFGFKGRKLGGTPYFGTLGIPDFESESSWQMLSIAHVRYFSDLLRIAGLSHGTHTWIDNAEQLIAGGMELKDVISHRDDIMLFLESRGMRREEAFRIMEEARTGRMSRDSNACYAELMNEAGIPQWYIESCRKILYLFPKANSANWIKRIWKLAFYKLYYPDAFYTEVLKYRSIPEAVKHDPDMLNIMISQLEGYRELTDDEDRMLQTLYLLSEARDRGCDINRIIIEAR